MKMARFFVKLSTISGPSIMDWLRSIYFSLVGSSVLNLVLKLTTYDHITVIVYIIANLLLITGLVVSVNITKRLKDYEKSYPEDIKDPKEKSFIQYCKDLETPLYLQHISLYTLWLIALLFLGYAGIRIEMETANSELKKKQQLLIIETKIDSLKNFSASIQEINIRMDSLVQALKPKPHTKVPPKK